MPAAHYLVNLFYCAKAADTLENFTCRTEKYIDILVSNKYYPSYSDCANYLHQLRKIR
jgi:hypothetical protein